MSGFFKTRRLLVDTCVWLMYYVGDDEAKQRSIRELFLDCGKAGIELLYAPSTLKDVFYMLPLRLKRKLSLEGETVADASYGTVAWGCVRQMMDMATAGPLSLSECELAWMLRKTHGDLGANLVVACAETSEADYIVTYDKRIIDRYGPVCVTPEQALGLLSPLLA